MGIRPLYLELVGYHGRLDRSKRFLQRVDDAELRRRPLTGLLPTAFVLADLYAERTCNFDTVADDGAILVRRRAWQVCGAVREFHGYRRCMPKWIKGSAF